MILHECVYILKTPDKCNSQISLAEPILKTSVDENSPQMLSLSVAVIDGKGWGHPKCSSNISFFFTLIKKAPNTR